MALCKDKTGFDKLLHLFMGFVIAAAVGAVSAHIFPSQEWLTYFIALTVAVAAGVVKEIRDSRRAGNHFCVWDLLATVAGGCAGAWVGWLAAHYIAVFI